MLNDIEHFRAKLGKIAGAGDLGDKLLEIVEDKAVAAAEKDEQPSEFPEDKQDQEKGKGSDSAES